MSFNLFISSTLSKKEFKKRHSVESCYFITEDDLESPKMCNEYQEFIYLQDLERLLVKTMKSKRFTSAYLNVTESHKSLVIETNYDFFISDAIKIISV